VGQTPDRRPGALVENIEVQLGINGSAPTVAGALSYNGTAFQLKDAAGVYDPRTTGGGGGGGGQVYLGAGQDHTTLQSAVDEAVNRTGAGGWAEIVVIGSVTVPSQVNILASGITIRGGDNKAELVWSGAFYMLRVYQFDDVTIRDLKFRSTATGTSTYSAMVSGSSELVTRLTVLNCVFDGNGNTAAALYFCYSDSLVIRDCKFIGMSKATGYVVRLNKAINVNITQNLIWDGGARGFYIADYAGRLEISHNEIIDLNTVGTGIEILGDTAPEYLTSAHIIANTIHWTGIAGGNGISISSSTQGGRVEICSNIVVGTSGAYNALNATAAGSTDYVIANNILSGSTSDDGMYGIIFRPSAGMVTCVGNRVVRFNYGILADCGNAAIGQNVVTDCSVQGITVQGSSNAYVAITGNVADAVNYALHIHESNYVTVVGNVFKSEVTDYSTCSGHTYSANIFHERLTLFGDKHNVGGNIFITNGLTFNGDNCLSHGNRYISGSYTDNGNGNNQYDDM